MNPRNLAACALVAALATMSPCNAEQSSMSQKPSSAPVSLSTLLREMVKPETIARWPAPAFTTRQVSSYDRRTVAPDKPGWWANDDFSHFIGTEQNAGRTERVMLDADGPGALCASG